MKNVIREITPISKYDFFVVLNHPTATNFRYPTHYHPEFELNMVSHFTGVRTIGDSVENVDAPDLCLVGPNICHSWHTNNDKATHIITIQFSNELFGDTFTNKNLFRSIRDLMDMSVKGVMFSQETIAKIKPRLMELIGKREFDSVIDFLSILYDLALARDKKLLCSNTFNDEQFMIKSRRIKKVCEYLQHNYGKKITVSEVAELTNMTDSGFCHFFKKRTQKSFVDFLNDFRIGEAVRMLLDTSLTISEISFACGFNNISNFNRIFLKKKGITPSEFRKNNINSMMIY